MQINLNDSMKLVISRKIKQDIVLNYDKFAFSTVLKHPCSKQSGVKSTLAIDFLSFLI